MPDPLLPQDTPVDYLSSRIPSVDGTQLFLHRWFPPDGKVQAHLLVLHGYMEHGGRYEELARHLCMAGIATTAVDLRGHGNSDGQRGYVARYSDYLDDAATALNVLETNAPHFVLGHSNGGVVALQWVHQRRPAIAGLMVTNPFLAQTHPAPGLQLWIGKVAGAYWPRLSLPAGLRARDLTHDPLKIQAHSRDPKIFSTANAAWFREVVPVQAEVRGYTSVPVPLLYVYSDADPVASPEANKQLAAQLAASPGTTVVLRSHELHEVLQEVHRATLHHQMAQWLRSKI